MEGQIQHKAIEEYHQRICALEAYFNTLYTQICAVEQALYQPLVENSPKNSP